MNILGISHRPPGGHKPLVEKHCSWIRLSNGDPGAANGSAERNMGLCVSLKKGSKGLFFFIDFNRDFVFPFNKVIENKVPDVSGPATYCRTHVMEQGSSCLKQPPAPHGDWGALALLRTKPALTWLLEAGGRPQPCSLHSVLREALFGLLTGVSQVTL